MPLPVQLRHGAEMDESLNEQFLDRAGLFPCEAHHQKHEPSRFISTMGRVRPVLSMYSPDSKLSRAKSSEQPSLSIGWTTLSRRFPNSRDTISEVVRIMTIG